MRDALQFAISHKLQWADFGYSHSKEIARPKRYWGAEEKQCRLLRNRNENNKRPSIQLSAVVRFFEKMYKSDLFAIHDTAQFEKKDFSTATESKRRRAPDG